MSIEFLSIDGITASQVAAGFKMSEIPGGRGIVSGFVLIIGIEGLTPGEFCGSSVLAPANPIVSNSGPADEFGNNSVELGWARTTDDIHWGQVSGGAGIFPNGFWDVLARGNIFPTDHGTGFITVQFSTEPVLDYTNDLTNGTDVPFPHDQGWDGNKGTVTLDVTYDDTLSEEPDSIAIIRNGVAIANIPIVPDTTDYSFTDTVFAAGTYTYSAMVYKYPNSRSAISNSVPVDFGGIPTITMTMSGGIEFGGAAHIVFIGDPTGTYTLIKDKTNDTLYNTEDDVKIPNPFIETAFLP